MAAKFGYNSIWTKYRRGDWKSNLSGEKEEDCHVYEVLLGLPYNLTSTNKKYNVTKIILDFGEHLIPVKRHNINWETGYGYKLLSLI